MIKAKEAKKLGLAGKLVLGAGIISKLLTGGDAKGAEIYIMNCPHNPASIVNPSSLLIKIDDSYHLGFVFGEDVEFEEYNAPDYYRLGIYSPIGRKKASITCIPWDRIHNVDFSLQAEGENYPDGEVPSSLYAGILNNLGIGNRKVFFWAPDSNIYELLQRSDNGVHEIEVRMPDMRFPSSHFPYAFGFVEFSPDPNNPGDIWEVLRKKMVENRIDYPELKLFTDHWLNQTQGKFNQGDINQDYIIDFKDYAKYTAGDWNYEGLEKITGNWLDQTDPNFIPQYDACDFNHDNIVNFRDYAILMKYWGAVSGPISKANPMPINGIIEPYYAGNSEAYHTPKVGNPIPQVAKINGTDGFKRWMRFMAGDLNFDLESKTTA